MGLYVRATRPFIHYGRYFQILSKNHEINLFKGHSITMWTVWFGKEGKKCLVFVNAQGIKTTHTGGGGGSRIGKILSK